MKLTNLAILFSLLAIISFLFIDTKVNNLAGIQKMKMEYDKRIDCAVEDGTYQLVEIDNNRKIVLNKDVAVSQFFNSLYANFHILGESSLEDKLDLYIPTIAIIDIDGFYIYYTDTYKQNDATMTRKLWTEKIVYTYEEENLIFRFTLGDYVYIYDKRMNKRYEGIYKELKNLYPNSCLSDQGIFEQIRRKTIINEIEKYMMEYINKHNHIAESFGISYHFSLPQIDKTDWYRTIDDISMLVLFQGYPYGINGVDFYNRYAFGGARITKNRIYYVERDSNGMLYYHKESCPSLTVMDEVYFTKEECALAGAFPCPECNP